MEQTTKVTKKDKATTYGMVDRNLVNSKKYHDKFEGVTNHKETNESVYQESMKILEHRDGTAYEDLIVLDARTGKGIASILDSDKIGKVRFPKEKITDNDGKVILLHNHPNSSRPSCADISKLKLNNVEAIIAVGHDGSVYKVSELDKNFDIDKFWKNTYNDYRKIYKDNILAEHYATDLLYDLKVFKVERW